VQPKAPSSRQSCCTDEFAPMSNQHGGNKPAQTDPKRSTIKSHTGFENKRALSVLHRKNKGFSQKTQCAVFCKNCTKRRKAFSAKEHCFSYAKLTTHTIFQKQCGI
jgi:hypothetical protein